MKTKTLKFKTEEMYVTFKMISSHNKALCSKISPKDVITCTYKEGDAYWKINSSCVPNIGNDQEFLLTTAEIEKYFDEVAQIDQGTIVVEKALIINDMRITRSNMEEFFENIRNMLA